MEAVDVWPFGFEKSHSSPDDENTGYGKFGCLIRIALAWRGAATITISDEPAAADTKPTNTDRSETIAASSGVSALAV
jgi:hypothetical protein